MSLPAPAARPTRLGHALVALLYLAVVLWAYRVILPEPDGLVAMPALMHGTRLQTLYQGDQRFVIGALAQTAHRALHDPTDLTGYGLCYPLRAPYTLGEHMFAETLLELPAYAATGDPILSYNVMVVLSLWIAALAMYALALHWTGSIPAAFVAGLLFAFHPNKVLNPGHPFVHGNLWTPLALLFAHRLFVSARWREALLLALFVSLQLLESFYQVLALAVLGGMFGAYLLVRCRGALPAVLPKLVVVAAVAAAVAWLVFAPYLETRAVWNVLQGRAKTLLFSPRDYLPGFGASVGGVAALLAIAGLLDRLRGARRTDGIDPRLVMLAAGLLVWWCTLRPFTVPGLSVRVPSPLVALADWVPGLDAVRVLRALRFGVYLVLSFLAAYGVLLLIERLPRRARWLATAVVAACALWETFAPSGLPPARRRPAVLAAYHAPPPAREIALVRQVPDGAVLDLPLSFDATGKLVDMPIYVLLAAYHQQPAAACYNSFRTPLQYAVADLAQRLPDPAAADALHALGFRSVVLHRQRLGRDGLRELAPLLSDPTRAREIGRAGDLELYALDSPHEASSSLDLLAAPAPGLEDAAVAPPLEATAPKATVDFAFANRGTKTFRHPTLEPLRLELRWRDAAGKVVASSHARALLPLALAPGATETAEVPLDVPASLPGGSYTLELAAADAPERTLARRGVVLSQARAVDAAAGSSTGSSSSLGLVSP